MSESDDLSMVGASDNPFLEVELPNDFHTNSKPTLPLNPWILSLTSDSLTASSQQKDPPSPPGPQTNQVKRMHADALQTKPAAKRTRLNHVSILEQLFVDGGGDDGSSGGSSSGYDASKESSSVSNASSSLPAYCRSASDGSTRRTGHPSIATYNVDKFASV